MPLNGGSPIFTNGSPTPQAVIPTLPALRSLGDLADVFCPTAEEAAERIESWAYWFARELVESVNDLARATRQSPSSAKLPSQSS